MRFGTAFRWGGRLAGGVAGMVLTEKLINPRLPEGKTFLRLPVVSGGGKVGWDDFITVAGVIAGAAVGGRAGSAISRAIFRRAK